jgi:hypothetical protein
MVWPASSTATVDDIPNELILEIIVYSPDLDWKESKLPSSSMLALSLTNKRFTHLVVRKIYASFEASMHVPYLYLRALFSRPYLTNSVKHADVRRSDIHARQTRNPLTRKT